MGQITFKDGIPGFEEYKTYQIELNQDEGNPFHTLQSLEEEDLSFTIINPFTINPSYDFNLSESTIEKLAIKDPKEVAVYAIVTMPDEDYQNITINLLAPIIINARNKQAKQTILSETKYVIKHKIITSEEQGQEEQAKVAAK